MSPNRFVYLNARDPDLFFSKLAGELARAQDKAPPAQWLAFIKGLTTKGVKGLEVEDSGVEKYLSSVSEKLVTKAQIIDWIKHNTPTIKEIVLSKPKYAGFHHGGHDKYEETLYVLNSQVDNIDDRLDELRFELEDLDFDLARLAADPEIAIRLANEQMVLLGKRKQAQGHHAAHFSNIIDSQSGEEIKNVLGHCRHTVRGDMYFIEEIQSDWAQRGRRNEWQDIPRAQFVTNTEAWASLIIKRQIQKACANPDIQHFAWIRGYLRNGWVKSPNEVSDGLDDFYIKIFPKIINKLLSDTGEKVGFMNVELTSKSGEKITHEVPGFKITEKVRVKMAASQPLYSRDLLARDQDQPSYKHRALNLNRELKDVQEMLGSCASVRLAAKVLEASSQEEVAGRQIGRLVEASMRARDPALTLSHEAWHYAYANLIGPLDRQVIDRAFQDGSLLNTKVRQALVAAGADTEAVYQCSDTHEAAAHGFALWRQGKITLTKADQLAHEARTSDPTSFGGLHAIFTAVEKAFDGLANWMKRIAGESQESGDMRHANDIFNLLASKRLAQDAVSSSEHQVSEAEESETVDTWSRSRRPRAA